MEEKKKIKFSTDEWYPVFYLTNNEWVDLEMELTKEELADFKRVYEEFENWQLRLLKVYREQR